MDEVYYFMISYAVVIVFGFIIVNWLSNGYLWPAARVKLSRGKLTLIVLKGVSGNSYKTGRITEGWLVFKDTLGNKRRLHVPSADCIERLGSVKTIAIDDEKNAIVKSDGRLVSGFDAVRFENLNIRALTSPQIAGNLLKLILIVGVVGAAIALIDGYLIFKLSEKFTAHVATTAINATVI